jgi:hypothetical protein
MPENDSKLDASLLLSRCDISAYFAAVCVVLKPPDEGFEADDGGRELSVREERVELGRGVGGLRKLLVDRVCSLFKVLAIGGGISCELLVSELNEEPDRDAGVLFSPSMLCSPNPLLLLCSIFVSISSRSFSLFLLSAMRSLNDLIFGTSDLAEFEREDPPATLALGLLRLTSCALKPLSIPNNTRAGLFGSSATRRCRMGE